MFMRLFLRCKTLGVVLLFPPLCELLYKLVAFEENTASASDIFSTPVGGDTRTEYKFYGLDITSNGFIFRIGFLWQKYLLKSVKDVTRNSVYHFLPRNPSNLSQKIRVLGWAFLPCGKNIPDIQYDFGLSCLIQLSIMEQRRMRSFTQLLSGLRDG